MFYEAVFHALEKHGVEYVVVGGVAVNLHGIPRMTADLDLAVELSSENLQRLLEAMKEVGYVPRLPVAPEDLLSSEKRQEWMTEKNMKVFTFWNKKTTFEQVDLLLGASENEGIFERGKRIQAGEVVIGVASAEDLIAMKQAAGRKQDLSDIEALKLLIETQNEES